MLDMQRAMDCVSPSMSAASEAAWFAVLLCVVIFAATGQLQIILSNRAMRLEVYIHKLEDIALQISREGTNKCCAKSSRTAAWRQVTV